LADQHPLSRLTIASTIALGLIAGLFSGWWAITRGMGGESYSGWYGSRVTGSKDADPWLRARVAVHCPWASGCTSVASNDSA
jgi:hypothetical protein